MTALELVQLIRSLVSDAKTEEALETFSNAAPSLAPDLITELTQLQAQFNQTQKDFLINGTLSREEYDRNNARITYAMLEMLESLEKTTIVTPAKSAQRSSTGKLLHSVPGVMPLSKQTRCIVRVAYDEATLLQDFKTTADTVIEDVRITEVMNVELCDYNEEAAFNIRNITDNEQTTEQDVFTEWIFLVKPLRVGTFPLTLKVTVMETLNGKERHRNVVLEKQVFIINAPDTVVAPPDVTTKPTAAADVLWEDTAVRLNYTITDRAEAAATMPPAPAPPPVAPRRTIATILTAAATVVMAIVGYRVLLPEMSNTRSGSIPPPSVSSNDNAARKAREQVTADSLATLERMAQADTLQKINDDIAIADSVKRQTLPKIEATPLPPSSSDLAKAARKKQEQRDNAIAMAKKKQRDKATAQAAKKKNAQSPKSPPPPAANYPDDKDKGGVNGSGTPGSGTPPAPKPETPRPMTKVAITGLESSDKDVEIVVDGKVIKPLKTTGGGLFSSEYTKLIELPAGMTHRVTFRNKQGGCTIEVTTQASDKTQKIKACQFRDVKKSDE